MAEFHWPHDGVTRIMGVLNVTPDSFSGDGVYRDPGEVAERAVQLVEDGADILDIGAESTRRGYRPVDPIEELERLVPALRAVIRRVNVPISVDTSKAMVALRATSEGAAIINDVSGLRDPSMLSVVAGSRAALVLVHNGVPPAEANPVHSIVGELQQLLRQCRDRGIEVGRIAVDPGLGIGGKDWKINFPIMRNLSALSVLDRPVLVGASRKGMIAKVLGAGAESSRDGSLSLAALCIAGGASVLRVHDVKESKQMAQVLDAIVRPGLVIPAPC